MFVPQVAKNCKELLDAGYTTSGSYRLQPSKSALSRFRAYCDQETAGGGWTVWMRRFDGYLIFNRDWDAYYEGFGYLTDEFWLGLRNMQKVMSGMTFSIWFDLETPDGNKTHAEYANCTMGNWKTQFALTVGPFVGKYSKNS